MLYVVGSFKISQKFKIFETNYSSQLLFTKITKEDNCDQL